MASRFNILMLTLARATETNLRRQVLYLTTVASSNFTASVHALTRPIRRHRRDSFGFDVIF
ncbi:MAG: hypothetical protein V1809_14300 [Planctomycetota bacterium]